MSYLSGMKKWSLSLLMVFWAWLLPAQNTAMLFLPVNRNAATVSRWCTNASQPSVEMLYEIAQWLDVDIRDLLNKTK